MASHKKTAFIREIVRNMQTLAKIGDDLSNLENEYFDNGYNSGGNDEILDSNLSQYDITATEFGSAITLMQQLEKFRTNQAVTTGDYAATLNKLRRAPV